MDGPIVRVTKIGKILPPKSKLSFDEMRTFSIPIVRL